jgi:hypothetical protein
MSCYLQPTEYQTYGLPADVTDDWITTASSLIDAHCRRASLNPTQFSERLRVVEGSPTVRLTYLPLISVAPATSPFVSIQARYAQPRRGELAHPLQEEILLAFSLPGTWTTLDPSTVDFAAETGELTLPFSVIGATYNEVLVTYTAGLATLPNAIKVACAQIVKNAQATPGLNVKAAKIDTMWLQYFSNSLVDDTVQALLRPWVSARMG